MHEALKAIPARILDVATGALIQANHHAVFHDPGMDHWTDISILNAATAGELFLKAIVAKEHPLLIFRDLFQLDDPLNDDLTIEHVIQRGRTYNFEQLPKLLWVATGERLPDLDSFNRLRQARNAIQHFCSPADAGDLRHLALSFIYRNIDPLINRHFGLCAVEYHEDTSIGYDHIVACVVRNELLFSVPDNFEVTEVDLRRVVSRTSAAYQDALTQHLAAKGFDLARLGRS